VLIGCGENNYTAGADFAGTQAYYMKQKISLLQSTKGLSDPFNIIAHSMGGLISREFIHENPFKVKTLVTLGTPHKGSPLAVDCDFVSYFINAVDAVDDLEPGWVQGVFNQEFPAPGPLAPGGAIYAIGGDADGWDCWGWGGELVLGWNVMMLRRMDNDGLVPNDLCYMDGIPLVYRFGSYDHYDLVLKPDVAVKAMQYALP
jgi:pimeloyl-ACP methyl ester carboxylesterase